MSMLTERFWSKVSTPDGEHGCWEWTASRDVDGYGSFWLDGKPRKAHRLSYEDAVGPVPTELQLDHLCRVRHCVNPAHLEPVTQKQNAERGALAMRTHCPQGHPYSGSNVVTYNRKDGRPRRQCRTCGTKSNRAFSKVAAR